MAYRASYKDIEDLSPSPKSGYKPSFDDISDMLPQEQKKKPYDVTPTNAMEQLAGVIQGLVKAGTGVGRTVESMMGVPENKQVSTPNLRMGKQSPIAEMIGQYAPFAAAGGSGLAGSTMAAGAYGATQTEPGQKGLLHQMLGLPPGGRKVNAIEDMVINMLTHGAQNAVTKVFQPSKPQPIKFNQTHEFSPGESEFTNQQFQPPSFLTEGQPSSLSEKIAHELHHNITGNRSIEQSGKDLASDLQSTYKKLHDFHKNQYDQIFEHPTEMESVFTGEPFKVKEIRMDKSKYADKFGDLELKDTDLKQLHDEYLTDRSIGAGHKLQSELGGEIGYLKGQSAKGLLDDAGRNKLSTLVKARNALKDDIRSGIESVNPKLKDAYDAVTESWKTKIEPFHSDKDLKAIVKGSVKNPTSSQLVSIFKNPEEDMQRIMGYLPERAKERLLHIGSGKMADANTPKDMIGARNAIEKKGLSSYVSPHHEQAFKNLQNNFAAEKEATKAAESNQRLIDSIKREHARAESARIAAANTRESMRKAAKQESSKGIEQKQKDLQKQFDDQFQLKQESTKKRNALIRSILGGTVGAGLVHGFDINPKDIMGGYVGKLLLGKR